VKWNAPPRRDDAHDRGKGYSLGDVLGAAWVLVMNTDIGKVSGRGEKGKVVQLPPPRTENGMALAEVLRSRRSRREFSGKPLSLVQIAQLCWAAQGITDDAEGFRTAPSAGALYPITVFVADANGVYEYVPAGHALHPALAGDLREKLRAAALDQPCVGEAPLCLVIAMDVARTALKYGSWAERYCLLEAGHIVQNTLLQATALGLAGVPVGAFDDRRVASILALPLKLRPVYLVPLGCPQEG
jgi:SagB-type dehydrogenase family enzyme